MNTATRILASKIASERRAARVAFEALLADEDVSWAEIDAANPTPAYIWQIKEATRIRQLDEYYRSGAAEADYLAEGDIDQATERAIENRNDEWASRQTAIDEAHGYRSY
jgi:hypothetical protein